jgi:hypothetical protein
MREELDKLLCEKYPKMFVNRNADMRETAMCWGFSHGDGWFSIIDALCSNIQHHIDWKNGQRERLLKDNPYNQKIPDELPQVVVDQVKEKFGTLRFYYHGGDDIIDGMVRMSESMSAVMCETCGAPAKRRGYGWIYTACDTHTREEDLVENENDNREI